MSVATALMCGIQHLAQLSLAPNTCDSTPAAMFMLRFDTNWLQAVSESSKGQEFLQS